MAICQTENIRQTLFLGCSVESFSCNLGFNEQPTEVRVIIVRDTCASPEGQSKVYYDINDLTNFPDSIEKTWTAADPGLFCYGVNEDEPPKLGAAVYFRFADFEFCGILQSWIKLQTRSDTDVYEILLTSPVQILEGCQLIIGDYTGPIKGLNIFNIYGFQEVFSENSYAPYYIDPRFPVDGPIMGSLSNAFGGADATENGMSWNKIKQGVNILTSSLIPINVFGYEEFSERGRITYFGGQPNARFGLISRDDIYPVLTLGFAISSNLAYYILDISELPAVPDYYRIPGPSVNILQLISQVCNDFGMDFYIELVPIYHAGSILKVIKIRTIVRTVQPDTTIVSQFIAANSGVIDSSFGRELRNENTTTFLIGGQKQSIWQVSVGVPNAGDDPEEGWFTENFGDNPYVRQRISQYFGKDSEGNVYIPDFDEDLQDVYINLDIRNRYNWLILDSILPSLLKVSFTEMRAAAQGYDSWSWLVRSLPTEFNQYITLAGLNIDTIFNSHILNNSKILARDLLALNTRAAPDQFLAEIRQYVQIIGDLWLESKRTLMVRVPWMVAEYNIDSTVIPDTLADLNIDYTDVPCEGGWTEANLVLFLPNPGALVDRMRLDNGMIRPFAVFDLTAPSGVSMTSKTLSEFNTAESFALDPGISQGQLVYYACNEATEPVFVDKTNLISPRVLVNFSQPLDFQGDSNNSFFGGGNGWDILDQFSILTRITNLGRKDAEKELSMNYFDPPVRLPDAIAIALKSNVHTYGPWKPNNIIEAGPPGQTRVEKHDDLVPWTFGSYAALNEIGQYRANEAVTVMNEGEVGTITIHGVPDIPLGAELASLQGLTDNFFPNSEHLIHGREFTFTVESLNNVGGQSTTFNVPTIPFGFWNGSYGPTVTNINVQFGPQGITTTYGFRTYTPKFGIMSKLNAERLEQRYIQDSQRRANIRFITEATALQKRYTKSLANLQSAVQRAGDVRATPGTPHSVFIADINPWNKIEANDDGEYHRTTVATKSLYEIQNNLLSTSGYNDKAIMSMDGLIRPVSMDGEGGLPRYATSTGEARPTTVGSIPPFGTGDGDYNSYYNYNLSIDYFNPLSNPSGFNRSTLSSKHEGISAHDIDIIARGSYTEFTGAGRSLIMPIDTGGYNEDYRADYTNDYRFLSLRGPLVIHGWGYDVDGKPIPNSIDNEILMSGSGIFSRTGLTDLFFPDFLRKPYTWPVAPVDLRFDRNRNLWVSPPEYEMVIATLTENINPFGSGNATISPALGMASTPTGGILEQGTIKVRDKVGQGHELGDKVIAYYDKRSRAYNIVEAKASGGGSSINSGGAIYFQVTQDRIYPNNFIYANLINCPICITGGTETGAGQCSGLIHNIISTGLIVYNYEKNFLALSGYKGYAVPVFCSGSGIAQYHVVSMEKQFPYTFISSGSRVSPGSPNEGEIPAATWDRHTFTLTPSYIPAYLMRPLSGTQYKITGLNSGESIVVENHFTQRIDIPSGSGIIGVASLISGNVFKLLSIDCDLVRLR